MRAFDIAIDILVVVISVILASFALLSIIKFTMMTLETC